MNVVTVLTEREKDNFKTLEYFLSMEDSEHLAQEALDRLLHLAGIAGDRWGVSRSSAVSSISCAGRLGVLGFDHDNNNFDSDKFEMEKKRILHSDNSNDWWSDRNAFYDAVTRDPENIFNFDEDVWVEAKAYRAEGKDRMANQTLNIDGVLFLQKHFQQNITKAPMWLSVEVMSLLASVKLTAQEASKLIKAHKGEMFSAASLFLLRSGLDVNKIVKLATNFHSYPENEGAIDLDETYMDFETYEKLPTIAKGYSKKIQKIVADLYSRYKPGMTEKSYIRSTRAHILNWVRYAIFQPSVEGLGSVDLSPTCTYHVLNCTVGAEAKMDLATVEEYKLVAEKLGAPVRDVLFQFYKEEVDLILDTPLVADELSLNHEFGVGIEGFRKLHKSDKKMLTVGEWSACCQKLGGAGAMAIALCKMHAQADTFAISVNGEDCGSMVVFALGDNRYIIDSIERRKMLEDSAIKALIAKLASQHKLYVSLSLEAEFNLSLDSEDFMSRSSHPEWNTLFNFADDFYIDTGARVSRVLP